MAQTGSALVLRTWVTSIRIKCVYTGLMLHTVLGTLLQKARAAVGLEQRDVARQLGVGQQAVSSWERGVSRPRAKQLPALCALLDLGIEDVRVAGEYESPRSVTRAPRLLVLPFENLSDEAFEAFCRDLFHGLFPGRSATRNGSTGFKQYGVDVIVDGVAERIGVQCKRHRTFGRKDVEAALAEVLPESRVTRGVIALSRPTATPGARLAITARDDWELWDGEDLSARVRDLPKHAQLALVDSYFPGLREPFLGIREPSPWLEVAEFDTALAGRSGYDRNFALSGRGDEYAKLSGLVGDNEPLVIVVGRGGIGKSRLLTEVARLELDRDVQFASRGPIAPEAFEVLPDGAPVIVIDDAMDADSDVSYLVGGIRAARPDATVILAVRPKALPDLLQALSVAEPQAPRITVSVDDLSLVDAEALATASLGDLADQLSVEALARIGYDCPLLIVIGAHLIREGHLSPAQLGPDGTLRREILTRFADVLVRGPNGDARIAVLSAVAAVQPARLDQSEFLEAIVGLSGQLAHAVLELIDELDDLGALLMRGHTVRVVPDLLGEAILERALVSKHGLDTRFAAHIAENARGDALASAIRNVSVIDWYRRPLGDSQLAEILWAGLIESVLHLPNSERKAMATGVQEVAAVYPQFALDFAEQLLANPAPDELDPLSGVWGGERYITSDDCARSLTRVIRNACYELSQLERGMRLLLSIGRGDQRPENQNPDHAMRMLREMGEYDLDRPVSSNGSYVRIIGEWLASSEFDDSRAKLISLLKPALADEVTVTRSKGLSISISHLSIDLTVTAPTRSVAIELAGQYLSSEPVVAVAAIALLEEALRAGDHAAPANDEFSYVATLLGGVLADPNASAGVRLSAYRALGWHATYGVGERKALVREVRRRLFVDADLRVTRMLRAGWALDDEDREDDDAERPSGHVRYQRSQDANEQVMTEIVESWETQYDDDSLLNHLHLLMHDELRANGTFHAPDGLLVRLFATRPSAARAALARAETWDPAVAATQRTALIALFASGDSLAESAAVQLMELSVEGALLAAAAVAQFRGPLNEQRKAVINRLAATANPSVARALLAAARWFDPTDRAVVLDLIRAAPVETDAYVADEVAGILADGQVVSWSSLGPSERSELLDRFAQSPHLPSFTLGQLLNEQIRFDARSALRFLQTRVDESVDRTDKFDALPHSWDTPLDFRSSADFPLLLNQLAEWLVEGDTWQRSFHGLQLFGHIVGKYDEEILALLLRLIRSNDQRRVRLASDLLNKAARDFAITELDFVTEAIGMTQSMEPKLARLVLAGLHGTAEFGMRSRSIGVDDPGEVALRDGALLLAAKQPTGSPIAMFYNEVAARATRRLESERADDLSLEQPRRW